MIYSRSGDITKTNVEPSLTFVKSHFAAFSAGAAFALAWVHWRVRKFKMPKIGAQTFRPPNHSQAMPVGLSNFGDQLIVRRGYSVLYSHAFMSPIACSFVASKETVQIKGMNEASGPRLEPFSVDKEIDTSFRPRASDFSAAGYHRGHLAARATVGSCPEAALETFLFTNVALMKPYCNAVAFKRIEHLTRVWATTLGGPLAVATGPLFPSAPHKVDRIVSGKSQLETFGDEPIKSKPNKPDRPPQTPKEEYQKRCVRGAPIPKAFFYSILHIRTGNTIGFIISNEGAPAAATRVNTAETRRRKTSRRRTIKEKENAPPRAVSVELVDEPKAERAAPTKGKRKRLANHAGVRTIPAIKVLTAEALEKLIEANYRSFGKRYLSSRGVDPAPPWGGDEIPFRTPSADKDDRGNAPPTHTPLVIELFGQYKTVFRRLTGRRVLKRAVDRNFWRI